MMRSKLGVLSLCIFILGSIMAFSAASAHAAFAWLVLDSSGFFSSELKALLIGETDSKDLTLLTKLLGKKFAITCTSFALINMNLEVGAKLTAGGKAIFKGCEAYGKGSLEEALGCNVKTIANDWGTIESRELKGELVLHEFPKEVLVKIQSINTTLATILTENCVLPEANPIWGTIYLKDGFGSATTHSFSHLIEQGPLTSIYVGVDSAEHLETSLDGTAWVRLGGSHSGLKWAAADV